MRLELHAAAADTPAEPSPSTHTARVAGSRLPEQDATYTDVDGLAIVAAYDYGSMMHYPRDACSKHGSDTLVPTLAGAAIGPRDGSSAGDGAAVEALYRA